jgi:hypothetical protein
MNREEKGLQNLVLVPLLRWLAAVWIVTKLTSVIITVVNVRILGSASIAAALFDGLTMLVIVAVLIYALSFLMPQVANTNTIINIPIATLLRYSIIAVLGLGILNMILASAASNIIGGSSTAQLFFDNIVWVAIAVIIFYVFSLMIEARNLPDVVNIKSVDSSDKQDHTGNS